MPSLLASHKGLQLLLPAGTPGSSSKSGLYGLNLFQAKEDYAMTLQGQMLAWHVVVRELRCNARREDPV